MSIREIARAMADLSDIIYFFRPQAWLRPRRLYLHTAPGRLLKASGICTDLRGISDLRRHVCP